MKKLLIAVAIIIVLIGGLFLSVVCKEYNEVKAIDRSPVSIGDVNDGVYEGCCETSLVKVRVKVEVSQGRIENVEILEHQCGKGKPAEVIAKEMADKNDIEVDAVSGATVSSEAIKAAVRDALR